MTAKTDPRPPYWPSANMIADLAGGGLTAAFGVVAALYNRCTNGDNLWKINFKRSSSI